MLVVESSMSLCRCHKTNSLIVARSDKLAVKIMFGCFLFFEVDVPCFEHISSSSHSHHGTAVYCPGLPFIELPITKKVTYITLLYLIIRLSCCCYALEISETFYVVISPCKCLLCFILQTEQQVHQECPVCTTP